MNTRRGTGSTLRIVLATLVVAAIAQGIALADIQVAGNTLGSGFYKGSTSLGTSFNVGVGSSLSYTPVSFGPQSSNTALDLGSFSLSCLLCSKNLTGYTFDLKLTFQVPAGTGAQTIVGDLTGTLVGALGVGIDTGGIDFGGPTLFSYSGPAGSGQFYVTVNDIPPGAITSLGSVALTGSISGLTTSAGSAGAAVPEPGSIVLLGTMLMGVSIFMRKRFSSKTDSRRQ